MARVEELAPSAAQRHEGGADLGRPRDMPTRCAMQSERRGTGTAAWQLPAPYQIRTWLPARWPRVATLPLSLCASVVLMLATLTACESVPSHAAATTTALLPPPTPPPLPAPT